jgi:type VI secretion system protein ImpM
MQRQALEIEALGFYGKLPSRGDFIRRGLTNDFIEPWHHAMALALADAQHPLAALWHQAGGVELRFVLGSGCAGPAAWCGVVLPSRDSVGRAFPLVCAIPLAHHAAAGRMLEAGGLLESAARILCEAAQGGVAPEALDQALAHLRADAAGAPQPAIAALDGQGLLFNGATPLAAMLAIGLAAGHSLWWRRGACLFVPLLPQPAGFARLLEAGL